MAILFTTSAIGMCVEMSLFSAQPDSETVRSTRSCSRPAKQFALNFCPVVPGMVNLFSKEQIIYFQDLGDLLEKIKYYHTHDQECRTIAEQGWRRAHSCYNSERITRYMMELLFDIPFTEDYEWQSDIFLTQEAVR
jgi:hypothetical protein